MRHPCGLLESTSEGQTSGGLKSQAVQITLVLQTDHITDCSSYALSFHLDSNRTAPDTTNRPWPCNRNTDARCQIHRCHTNRFRMHMCQHNLYQQSKNGVRAWEHGRFKAVWEIICSCKAVWDPNLKLSAPAKRLTTMRLIRPHVISHLVVRRFAEADYFKFGLPNRFAGRDYFPNCLALSMLPCVRAVFCCSI